LRFEGQVHETFGTVLCEHTGRAAGAVGLAERAGGAAVVRDAGFEAALTDGSVW
jgi:hypothetical protein